MEISGVVIVAPIIENTICTSIQFMFVEVSNYSISIRLQCNIDLNGIKCVRKQNKCLDCDLRTFDYFTRRRSSVSEY